MQFEYETKFSFLFYHVAVTVILFLTIMLQSPLKRRMQHHYDKRINT